MGTDRTLEYEGPCDCGQGKFHIDDCEPDHSWGGRTWYEANIHCGHCREIFSIKQIGSDFVLIEKKELKEQERRKSIALEKSKSILSDSNVQKILGLFEQTLSFQKSIAGRYRLLKGIGLESSTEQTFRRHWVSDSKWIKDLTTIELVKIYSYLNKDLTELNKMLHDLSELEAYAKIPPRVYKKIYSLK